MLTQVANALRPEGDKLRMIEYTSTTTHPHIVNEGLMQNYGNLIQRIHSGSSFLAAGSGGRRGWASGFGRFGLLMAGARSRSRRRLLLMGLLLAAFSDWLSQQGLRNEITKCVRVWTRVKDNSQIYKEAQNKNHQ